MEALGFDARLDATDLADRGVVDAALRPAHRVDQPQEPLAEIGVASDWLSAQQRLRLPHLRPACVVGLVGRQRPHQRPLPTLRAERSIDLNGRVGRRQPQQSAQLVRDRVSCLRCLTLDRTGQRIGDEHHVGIARVLLLVAAEPTHADHGDAHGQWAAALGLDLAQGDPKCAGDGRRGEVRQRLRDDVDRQQAEDVAGGDADRLAAADARAASTAWTGSS